jgi:HAD superfamily hydrolase (TIGR01548 family)
VKPPELIIFDVDGVLVDVRESFDRTILAVVRQCTGRQVARAEIQRWRSRSGFNDDWELSYAWIRRLGGRARFPTVKRLCNALYWGRNGKGFVCHERWLLPRPVLRRLARRAELAIFTGRTRRELRCALRRFGVEEFFACTITQDDVRRKKPNPEGLLQILRGRRPDTAIYLGDNVDDALAARAAGVPFLGVLPRNSLARRLRGAKLRRLGACALLSHVAEIEPWLDRE